MALEDFVRELASLHNQGFPWKPFFVFSYIDDLTAGPLVQTKPKKMSKQGWSKVKKMCKRVQGETFGKLRKLIQYAVNLLFLAFLLSKLNLNRLLSDISYIDMPY